MATIAVRKIAAADPVAAEEYFLPPQKLLQGNPRQTVWMHYTDPSAKFMVGIWHSERGRWTILYTEEEFCRILEGVSVLTDEAGGQVTVRAGDEFVIPAGFSGSWEVLEPTRKRLVIYEAATALPGESTGSDGAIPP